ncbi:MAG: glycoside hydrolase family 3 N-terminal domain-containing protein [Proteiniphilum sp.]|nr:glycoside hydrolase family 3 N-terminal domain-containing protein [Proteiniphilum sp.]MDD3909537.1 glycoside hydrolase family 3 N-terminal domain-containing protein [Proteiniphilum sp.]MDD4415423.1 glycoside hydrolase family 3 N-terminal domain-containing protein [Proteiniphilum sp.]
MSRTTIPIVFILALILITDCNSPSSGTFESSKWQSFSNDKNVERRVDSLLKLMTLEEKIGQMAQFSANWSITGPVMSDDFRPYLEKGLIGSIFNATTVEGIRRFQQFAVDSTRLRIPILFGQDVIHGYKTIFPIPLGEACSWDLEMMRRTAEIAAIEAASDGINWTFAPMVDISRDARWGRVMEGAGEDPWLGSKVAEARVSGFQGGKDSKSLNSLTTLLACGKHLAAYGAAESGRDYNPAELSEHTLRNVYLPPYKAAIDAGVGTMMASFNEINGVPATANRWLLTKVLRNEWRFTGFVVSDYTGINELVPHGVAENEKHAAELAINAGIDMDMTGATFIKHLVKSVNEGKVPEKAIDNATRRILEMKFLLGLFDDPYRYLNEERAKQNTMTPEFMETARKAVASSVVLLKNENNLLPVKKDKAMTVALVGPLMNDSVNMNGEWAGLGDRNKSISILRGVTEKYKGSSVKLIYAEGSSITETTPGRIAEAVLAARRADIVIAAMGEDFNWSGEAAVRTDIRLPGAQRELLQALKQTGKPIVLISLSGRPLDLSWEDKNLAAILHAWFPGTQGGFGIADVVAGDYNPSGRLVISFPRNVGQIPVYYNQKNTGRPVNLNDESADYKSGYLDTSITPLYPFGYGLSYTTFKIDNVKTDKKILKSRGDKITVTADVRNTGPADGEIIVQLYTRQLIASVTRPVKELKGFKKIALKAGESKQVTFNLASEDLAFYGIEMKKKTEPGDFKLWIAQSSADNSNEKSFSVTQ